MKRLIMVFAAAIVMGSAAQAQKNDSVKAKRLDKSEMIKRRTEMQAQRYSLTDEQKAKLLELNKVYIDSMRAGISPRGGRAGNFTRPRGGNSGVARDSVTRNNRQLGEGHRNIRPGAQRGNVQVMKNYNAKLKEILTDEQYEKYLSDMKNANNRKGTRGGQRPEKPANAK